MKLKSILFFVLLLGVNFKVNAQVIEKEGEWIQLSTGDRQEVIISRIEDEKLYFFNKDDVNQQNELKVPLSALSDYYMIPIHEIPLKHNDVGQVEYSEVVQVPDASKNELYNRARLWFADAFNNSESVLEVDDREAGILVGTGWSSMMYSKFLALAGEHRLWVTIKIQVKENRYKYTINSIQVQNPASKYVSSEKLPVDCETLNQDKLTKAQRNVKESIMLELQMFCYLIKSGMTKAVSDGDDW